MEKVDIILPEPIHAKKIYEKLDLFAQDNLIRRWAGYDIIDTLFYLYLFNKYKNQCLVKYTGVSSNTALGVELQIKQRMSKIDKQIYEIYLKLISNQVANCIKRNQTNIVIPLYLKTKEGGHANILIYRKQGNIIEHFEPHGSKSSFNDEKINKLVNTKLNEFISILNEILKKDKFPTVKLITANIICPRVNGLQVLEDNSKLKKTKLEEAGYCAAWSMFFSELALKNPNVSSEELINIIFKKLDTMNSEEQRNYLRKVIIGYVNLIYEKIEKYFSFITGTKLSVADITEMLKKGNSALFKKDYNTIVNIEIALLNNPNLTKEQYLERLRKQEMRATDDLELEKIRHKINILEKMGIILNPSPVSSESVKSKKNISRTPSSKNISIRKKRITTKPPVELEEIIVEEEIKNPVSPKSIPTTKKEFTPIELETSFVITPNCPEGKIFNPKKGRCVKIRTKTQKKISPTPSLKSKTKKMNPCPKGKERNPETGRCRKIKVYPPCPPGKERNPITHRCKKISLKKK